ncbi:MAG: type II toxin-antitoxin system RelE/ParE family toxin [Sphingomonadales bacterium]|nr:type II toxin-antitoxin system RelE/ParE family toxin [Sphingomonadales bacterium]
MTHDVILSDDAEDDLFAIPSFIAEHADRDVADGFVGRLRDACLTLADFPKRGTPHPQFGAEVRSIPLQRRTTIFYRVEAETVTIIHIARIAPGPGFVVLTGENGAGKTNVLEAVSMLAPGRGLRRATLAEMARQDGPGGFAISARAREKPLPFRSSGSARPPDEPGTSGGSSTRDWVGVGESRTARDSAEANVRPHPPTPSPEGEGEVSIGTGTTVAAPDRRKVRINGADASATALADWLTVLWLTPAMDRLFTGSPSDRRRFLDRLTLALEPGHGRHAARYEAALRARNRLLSDPGALDADWCAALELQLGEHGAALAEARARTVAALNAALASEPDAPFAKPLLAIEDPGPEADLGHALAAHRARDRRAGRTLIGPHRHDLAVTHAAKAQPAEHCSTGEQKAMLLALILAQADLVADQAGCRAVLLLDEVAAHLDPLRRAALFERLGAAGGQVWMTGTEPGLFADLPGDAQRFAVEPGKILPA